MMRWDIINHLIKKNNYKSYLEIGYYKGWSFDNVNCLDKIAVDPNPCKAAIQESAPYGIVMGHADAPKIFKFTSDDFFRYIDDHPIHRTWDIIFIDGLHESAQVTRDLNNSLRHLSEGGVIVMHDCNPPKYEHTTTGIDGCWTGDTYKSVLEFRKHGGNIKVIDTDWGVGIVGIEKMNPVFNIDTYDLAIQDWSYFNEYRKDLLNLITVEEFLCEN